MPGIRMNVQDDVVAFTKWLGAKGAQVLQPTSVWEVCRYKSNSGTSIVYTNKTGRLRFTGDSLVAWTAYVTGAGWRAIPATKRKLKSSPTCQALRVRDGDDCFFCRTPVEVEDESVEHLVAITHGGPDHLSNMALSHRVCNNLAGHLSVMEKIILREERSAPVEAGPPWEV
jgi:hypothetical protein